MANVCVSLGIAPSEYKALAAYERDALVREHNRQVQEAKRRR